VKIETTYVIQVRAYREPADRWPDVQQGGDTIAPQRIDIEFYAHPGQPAQEQGRVRSVQAYGARRRPGGALSGRMMTPRFVGAMVPDVLSKVISEAWALLHEAPLPRAEAAR